MTRPREPRTVTYGREVKRTLDYGDELCREHTVRVRVYSGPTYAEGHAQFSRGTVCADFPATTSGLAEARTYALRLASMLECQAKHVSDYSWSVDYNPHGFI